jgi:LemA protein
MTETLLIAVAAGACLWIAWTFNRLIRYRNRVRSGWSDIDVQLQRRHDLIPQLVDAVKGYAGYEQATLTAVTELRSLSEDAEHLSDKAAVDEEVATLTHRLLALAESYPDLKANRNFLSLQQELTGTEDQLQYARRFYNGAVREFNTLLESFPALIVARLFAFRAREFFTADSAAAAAVRVKLA